MRFFFAIIVLKLFSAPCVGQGSFEIQTLDANRIFCEDVPFQFDLQLTYPIYSQEAEVYWLKNQKCSLVSASPSPSRFSGDTIWWEGSGSGSLSVTISAVISSNSGMLPGTIFKQYAGGSFNAFDIGFVYLDSIVNRFAPNNRIGTANKGLTSLQGMQWHQVIDTAVFAENEPRQIVAFGKDQFVIGSTENVTTSIYHRRKASIWKGSHTDRQIIWRKDFYEPNSDYFIRSVEAGPDSVIYGFGGFSDKDIWIVKLDKDGNLLWSKTFGGSKYDALIKATIAPNGDIIVLGSTYSTDGDVPNVDPLNKLWLMRIDKLGNVLSSKLVQVVDAGVFVPVDVYPNHDGSIVVFAGLTDGNAFKQQMFIKLDGDFNLLSSKTISQLNEAEMSSVARTADGGFIITGVFLELWRWGGEFLIEDVDRDVWLVKIDSVGNWEWEKYYGGKSYDAGKQVKALPNNHFLVIADTQSRDGNVTDFQLGEFNAWLFETDSVGNLLWQTTLSNVSDNAAHILGSVTVLADQSILGIGCFNQLHYYVFKDVLFKIGSVSNITGQAFLDINKNEVKDQDERLLNGFLVSSTKGTSSVSSVIANGSYVNKTDTGIYVTKLMYDNGFYKVAPQERTVNIAALGIKSIADFAIQPTADVKDLTVELVPITRVRPGMGTSYLLAYENCGTTPITNVMLKLVKDHRSLFDSSSFPIKLIVEDTIIWSIGDMKPLEKGTVTAHFTTAPIPNVQLGDTLRMDASITPMLDDSLAYNNVSQLEQVVVGAFDPNDKNEKHGNSLSIEKALAGENLIYTIRFQNVGTDTAFNILIRDTLRKSVNYKSVQSLFASHAAQFSIREDSILEWKLNQIRLPPKDVDESGSQGYVIFKLKLDSVIRIGDTIPNNAAIYFDFNPSIVTNLHVLHLEPGSNFVCPGGSTRLVAELRGRSYQWQINTGNGFVNLTNGSNYSGVHTETLVLNAIPTMFDGDLYRCLVQTEGDGEVKSAVHRLLFANSWLGATSASWEDPANWSCGTVPTQITEVLIKAGTPFQPEVSTTTATCKSIVAQAGAHVWVKVGAKLNVAGK